MAVTLTLANVAVLVVELSCDVTHRPASTLFTIGMVTVATSVQLVPLVEVYPLKLAPERASLR